MQQWGGWTKQLEHQLKEGDENKYSTKFIEQDLSVKELVSDRVQ